METFAFPDWNKMTQLIFRQKAYNSNVFESSAMQNVHSSKWDCNQSTASKYSKVIITYYFSIPEIEKNIANYNDSLMSFYPVGMW